MGEYSHNIDRKGRLIMPAKFREELQERVVVNRGLDGCLYVYTMEQWSVVQKKIATLPTTKKDARNFQRMMLAKADECDLDSQGRILIPARLIQLAKLEKECVIVGVGNHIEIWAKDRWQTFEDEQQDSFEEFAENLTDFMDLEL